MLAELEAEAAEVSYEAHLARRAAQEAATGRPIRGKRPVPGSWSHTSRQHANLTDPDSRIMKTRTASCRATTPKRSLRPTSSSSPRRSPTSRLDTPSYVPMIQAAKGT